jgi:hypothetical protein
MSAADLQARLNVILRDIIVLFENEKTQQHSVDLLNKFIDEKKIIDFLKLAESFGRCMSFLNHDELMDKIYHSWSSLSDGYNLERKNIIKKIKTLKEDKKTDPDYLQKQENLLLDIDARKCIVMEECMRTRIMVTLPIDSFIKDENFDYMTSYQEQLLSKKIK